MKSIQSEAIWNGKIHLGDEPGIYGDAEYCGLSFEYPITIENINAPTSNIVSIIINTSHVKIYEPYLGHKVTLYLMQPEDINNPYSKWLKKIIKCDNARIIDNGDSIFKFNLEVKENQYKSYLSIKIEVDTEVKPGLYDDFLINSISFFSENYTFFASFGFK